MPETLEAWADRATHELDDLERDLRENAQPAHGRPGNLSVHCPGPAVCDRCQTLARADRVADLAADRRRL